MQYPFKDAIEHDTKVDIAKFNFLTNSENDLLQKHFLFPSLTKYPAQIIPILRELHQICCIILPAENSYYVQLQKKQHLILNKLDKRLPVSSQLTSFTKRSQLHQYLTHFPLYSTLLLLDSKYKDHNERQWWLTLLARLYLHHNGLRYDDSLEFSRTMECNVTFLQLSQQLPLHHIENITSFELKNKLIGFATEENKCFLFASSFDRRITKQDKLLKSSINTIKTILPSDNGIKSEHHHHTDDDGNTVAEYLEFEPIRTKSVQIQQILFKKMQTGMANSIRRNNLALPLSLMALPPLKFQQFLKIAMPDLYKSQNISIIETSFRIIFWLEIWIGKPYASFLEMKLFNTKSHHSLEDEIGFHYFINAHSNNLPSLFLRRSTTLVKGKKADVNNTIYDQALEKGKVDIIVPYPLQHYLLKVLSTISASSNRHNKTITNVLKISIDEYKRWLKAKILLANQTEAQNITESNLRNTFHHFSQSQLAKSDRAILQSQGVISSFYINSDHDRLQASLQNNWLTFIALLNLNENHLSIDESNHLSIKAKKNSLNAFGAGLCINEEIQDKLISYFSEQLKVLSDGNKNKLENNRQLITEMIACYLYFRTSITCAIRPVKKPIPIFDYIEPSLGLILTQDKDAHQNGELRLLAMDSCLSRLWKLAKALQSPDKNMQHYFQAENAKNELQSLLKSFGVNIDSHSFRHTSASLFATKNGNNYQQLAFDQLMNHFDYGQSPLRPYSLLTINELVSEQQSFLNSCVASFITSDTSCMQLMEKLQRKGIVIL